MLPIASSLAAPFHPNLIRVVTLNFKEWPLLVGVIVGCRTVIWTVLCNNIVIMSHEEAARFRSQAEEALEQAAKAFSPLDKEPRLRVAEEWLKLATSADGRQGNKTI
jgi:hypothetical protein